MANTVMHNDEYLTIADVEEKHWWYRSLHELVLLVIDKNFESKEISIIDAGCGTGGLMAFLKKKGYKNVKGFDISEIAVDLCHSKGLDVFVGDLNKISGYFAHDSADVIVSNDTFYFMDESGQRRATDAVYTLLKKNGVFILNLPSLKAFSGIHDLRVGINRRFNRNNIWKLFDRDKFILIKQTYWPFLLSPAIWLVRSMQRIRLKFNSSVVVSSDVKSENKITNALLFYLTGLENSILVRKPFGSSLFLVARAKHA